MTSRARGYIAALIAACACTDGTAPGTALEAPTKVSARALSMHVVRLEWTAGAGPLEGYRIERRVNLTGPFSVIASAAAHSQDGALVTLLDADVEPETFYGYRVISLGALGQESGPSVIAGTRTPPFPGIEVQTGSTVPVPAAVDTDGYWVRIDGPNEAAAPLGVNDQRVFTPLPPGTYSVSLSGVRSSCDVLDGATRTAIVADTGLQTVTIVGFRVVCRDPALGRIRGSVVVAGDSADPNDFRVTAMGVLADTSLPPSQRVVHLETGVLGTGGSFDFDGLRPGAYEVTLDDVAAHCSVAGERMRQATVAPLSMDSLHFDLTCQGSGGAGRPFVWRNTWSPSSAPSGANVALDVVLDLTAVASERSIGAQGELRYDATVLRYDSATPGAFPSGFIPNTTMPGLVAWLGATFGTPPGGAILLARFHFTVTGSAGAVTATRSTITEVFGGDSETRIDSLVRIVEDTIAVTAPGANQPPNAEANGPYGGAAGTSIAFSPAGSTDPDGTISSYAWAFGDGGNASGASPSHTYATAGTYTATLTVTDNLGATDTDHATVTVTPAGGGTTPFTWQATFGALNPVDSVVALTITLDLTTDIPETSGPEALASFVIDSLKWNPTVLRFQAFNWGPGGAGSLQRFDAQGKLIVSNATLLATANSGILTLATIRFKAIGAGSTTTATAVGPLIGTPATGSYNYRPRTRVVEATFTAP